MTVNICGIPHEVVECENTFDSTTNFGQIDFVKCRITLNKELAEDFKSETLCHEMLHGMLVHLGYDDLSEDEKFVQALGNAISQGFVIREEKEHEQDARDNSNSDI